MVRSCIFIRHATRRDLDSIVDLDETLFGEGDRFSKKDFIDITKTRGVVLKVMEIEDGENTRILGYILYEIKKKLFIIYKVGVLDKRKGIGTVLVQEIINKLSSNRRYLVSAYVGENNLEGQLFFKSLGFVCKGSREFGFGTVYEFEYSLFGFLKNRFKFQKKTKGTI